MQLRVASLNVRFIASARRRATTFDFFSTVQADIFLLQECGVEFKLQYEELENDWKYGQSVWSGENGVKNSGVGILIKNKSVEIISVTYIEPGRAILIKVSFMGKDIKIINIYGSVRKNERCDLFEKVKLFLMGQEPVLVMGDFNCILRLGDRSGDSSLDRSSKILSEMCEDLRLQDVWSIVGNDNNKYTWQSTNTKSRIDHCFVANGVKAVSWELCDNLFSDHCLVLVQVRVEGCVSAQRGLWKLNVLLLEDERMAEQFCVMYVRCVRAKTRFQNVLKWWDWFKIQCKNFFIRLGVRRRNEQRQKYFLLNTRWQCLIKLKDIGVNVSDAMEKVCEERKKWINERGKEIVYRAKVEELEKDEKCTRFFFKKCVQKKSVINEMDG